MESSLLVHESSIVLPSTQLKIRQFFHSSGECDIDDDDDDDTIVILDSPSDNHPLSLDRPNDSPAIATAMNGGEKEPEDNEDWDPRGFNDMSRLLPSHYCPHCRCPKVHCHNKMFGGFCELHIVNEAFHADEPLTNQVVEQVYRERYNDALQFKIFERTGTLDVTPTGYVLPQCIHDNSLADCIDYINFRNYHFRMHNRLRLGRDVPADGGASLRDDIE
jgi:hypothetical protein